MKKSLNTAFLALGMMAAASAASAQQPQCEPAKVAAKYPSYAGKVVKIAASPTQPPQAFIDAKNPDRMLGLEVEMITQAMDCAGLKYEFVKGTWAALLNSMFNGAADVMIGSVNWRQDRGERVDFIIYAKAGQAVVVQKGNPKKIAGVDDLCGATGSSTVGGSSSLTIEAQSKLCVERGKKAINYLPSPDAEAAYRQVNSGRNDFAMDDAASAAARLQKEPEFQAAFTIVSNLLTGFVVPKGNKEMLQVVADGLRVQQKDGSIAKLMTKYGIDPALQVPVETRN